MDDIYETRNSDGSYFWFNFSQDYRVFCAKHDGKESSVAHKRVLPFEHPLIGKKISHNNRVWLVQKVYKEFYGGWFVKLLLECNGSHSCIFWDNINCFDPIILANIKKNKEICKIVE